MENNSHIKSEAHLMDVNEPTQENVNINAGGIAAVATV